MDRLAVIGAGSWGTAFAGLCASGVSEVALWCHSEATAAEIGAAHTNERYLPGYELPPQVVATSSMAEALGRAEACVLALPSTHLRATCAELAPHVASDLPVVVLTKGVEPASGLLMTEVAASELGGPERFCALSGPNHAEEVCRALPSAAVLASENLALAERLRPAVSTPAFRVYVSGDLRGVEVCGAYKNVIAVACGICVGYGGGDNTLALIMTRGVAEMGRLVSAYGGDPMTCMGLAGMGDLVATCTSEHSRNRRFGEAFAAGTTLGEFERASHMVVEGAHAVVSIRELGRRLGVETPIADAVWQVVHGGVSADSVAGLLMGRMPTEEFYGMGGRKRPARHSS